MNLEVFPLESYLNSKKCDLCPGVTFRWIIPGATSIEQHCLTAGEDFKLKKNIRRRLCRNDPRIPNIAAETNHLMNKSFPTKSPLCKLVRGCTKSQGIDARKLGVPCSTHTHISDTSFSELKKKALTYYKLVSYIKTQKRTESFFVCLSLPVRPSGCFSSSKNSIVKNRYFLNVCQFHVTAGFHATW